MNLVSTGTACDADDTSIANLHGTFTNPCVECVCIMDEPGTVWSYSSGGFVVAEAMIEEESGRTSRNFLYKDILEPYGLDNSTFKNAGPGIANLATACDSTVASTGLCACPYEIAKVKFPGGLLANPSDYARLLMIIMHDGDEPIPEGEQFMTRRSFHASAKLIPTMVARISMRLGAIPIWNTIPRSLAQIVCKDLVHGSAEHRQRIDCTFGILGR